MIYLAAFLTLESFYYLSHYLPSSFLPPWKKTGTKLSLPAYLNFLYFMLQDLNLFQLALWPEMHMSLVSLKFLTSPLPPSQLFMAKFLFLLPTPSSLTGIFGT